ncbi:LegC family aminotransferase [Brevibacillus sp. MER 51]|uniref:LegC family aminotransferase n=1 Tax=Brevibacillus sp. MER 51 TaxID=2939560 RepID=UPI00203F4972|nr:LegC family aminotransferase [Brevibacillus sp. MER 51]MCM3143721.1 LegC family aminotransferase [Brevibacillus sp. MER 51]
MKTTISAEKIVSILNEVISPDKDFIALHEPSFQGNEWVYVKECLDTGWVSSVGKYVDKFEEMLKEYTGTKRAVAVVNGTAALHICLKLVGVERDDEVIIPALSFIATANAVAYCGAIPHFVDSSEATLGLDPVKLDEYLQEIAVVRDQACYNKQTGRRIKAVVPMHTFGHPVELDKLVDVCERYHLELIEDAAESLGSYYKGRHTGNWGRVSALSFNGNKIMTTGGGGAIITNDESLGQLAKHLTTTAKQPHAWEFVHDQVGYNYRMPNINAALGCAQLEQLPAFLAQKRALAHVYQDRFSDVEGVSFITEPNYCTSNYWLNTLRLKPEWSHLRDDILRLTNEHGLMTRPVWRLLSSLPMYEQAPRMDLTVALNLESSIVNIPSSSNLGAVYVES